MNSAYRFHVQCLELNLACEEGLNADCTTDLAAGVAACPQLPTPIQPMFLACTQ